MTRQDFIDNVTTWGDLVSFCYDNDLDYCESIYDEEQKDDYVDERIVDWARENPWRDVLRLLESVPDGTGDYYFLDDYGDFVTLDDYDLREKLEYILDELDERDFWEPESQEYEEEQEDQEEQEEPCVEQEDFSVGDLFAMCKTTLVAIKNESQKEQEDVPSAEFSILF